MNKTASTINILATFFFYGNNNIQFTLELQRVEPAANHISRRYNEKHTNNSIELYIHSLPGKFKQMITCLEKAFSKSLKVFNNPTLTPPFV